ncbi:hypothetical protein QBC39DRAFT_259144, partial [Podospora conica]
VVDDLPVGTLLGNNFLNPFEVNINYGTNIIAFGKISGFTVDFEVVLLPRESIYIPINYKLVSNNRSFSFKVKYDIVIYLVLNVKLLIVVLIVNNI